MSEKAWAEKGFRVVDLDAFFSKWLCVRSLRYSKFTLVKAMSINKEHFRVYWKAGEDINKSIIWVEMSAAACRWDKAKTEEKAALSLPDDK